MNLGANIKRLRKERGMSQQELAARLDLGQSTVSAWERGTAFPLMDNVQKMAQLWDVPIQEITGDIHVIDSAPKLTATEQSVVDALVGVNLTEYEANDLIEYIAFLKFRRHT